MMREGGIEATVERYNKLRSGRSDTGNYYKYRLSGLGRFYLENRDFEKAIGVFKLDVESFPDSARVHNALGRAYVSAGKPESAAECYRKSLALDSGDRNEAYRLLKEIRK